MKRLILFILTFAYIMPSFAQSKEEGIKYGNSWWMQNVPENYTCKGTYDKMGLSGLSGSGSAIDISKKLQKNYLNHVAEEYIAREINHNGAKFCKTFISGGRSNCYGTPYTTYHGEENECFWLCKEGYYGNSCVSTTPLSPGSDLVGIEGYASKHTVEGFSPLKSVDSSVLESNVEDKIPMFVMNNYVGCGSIDRKNLNSSKNQEHDIVLMLYLIRETSNDEEMYMLVTPLVVRAGGTRGCYMDDSQKKAWPMLSIHGMTHTAVCPSDYYQRKSYIYAGDPNNSYKKQDGCPARGTPIADIDIDKVQLGTTGRADGKLGECYVESRVFCIYPDSPKGKKLTTILKESQAEIERIQSIKNHICDGHAKDLTLYDEKLHTLVVVEKETFKIVDGPNSDNYTSTNYWSDKCSLIRCKTASNAFKPEWQKAGDAKCYPCTGDFGRFGIDNQGVCQQCVKGEIFDSNTKKCEKARVFSKNDMRFGVGNAPSVALEDQCWTKDNPDCYKCCMMDKSGESKECKQCAESTKTESAE